MLRKALSTGLYGALGAVASPPRAPAGPQLGPRPKPRDGGPSPFLIIGLSLAAGIALAKFIDWRGHAHPKR